MGASNLETVLSGKLTVQQLHDKFAEMQDIARRESGNSYSGDWNMMNGLVVKTDKVFSSVNEASDHILDNTEKWENALAVRAKSIARKQVKAPTFGGREAPFTNNRKAYLTLDGGITPADQLTDLQKARLVKLVKEYRAAAGPANDDQQAFLRLVRDMEDLKEPFAKYAELRKARAKSAKSYRRLAALQKKLKALDEQYVAKVYKDKIIDQGEVWVIGGWAAE